MRKLISKYDMLRTSFVLILILLSSNVLVHAQFIQGYGIKGGLSLSNLCSSSSSEDFMYTTGLDIGAYIELLDLPSINILPEMHYIQKSHRVKGNYDGGSRDYLSIPIHAKILIEQVSVAPYFILGPRIDILVANNYFNYAPFHHGGESKSFEYEDVVFGANVGLGVETKVLKPVTLLIEFRYSPDFTYATKLPDKLKNISFGILIGAGF